MNLIDQAGLHQVLLQRDGSGLILVALIFDVYMKGRDRSGYALMNAVTSVARDTRDPELRWRLEEFGGGIAAHLEPEPEPDDAAAGKSGRPPGSLQNGR